MTNQREQDRERLIQFSLTVSNSNPALLEGLDTWLQLGLISDMRVKQLCQQYLSCQVPEPVISRQPVASISPDSRPQEQRGAISQIPETETRQQKPNLVAQMWRSLREDFSVKWVLFLGVFLVVVSSGLLAATYWQSFTVSGQYLVLFAYTIVFWLICSWLKRQQNLQLTAKALQWVTLLLIPVNFWAMDGLGLWQHPPIGWIIIAIGAISLTSITYRLLKSKTKLILLIPCYLHFGWQYSGFPLMAAYLGMVAITAGTVYYTGKKRQYFDNRLPIYALAILLIRAIFIAGVGINELGLAIATCGWLLTWKQQQNPAKSLKPLTIIGSGLLFLGWVVSVNETFPWQATVISGLILGWFSARLRQFWQQIDLLAIILIGGQTFWLVWRLIPQLVREDIISTVLTLTGATGDPSAIVGLMWFPYLIGIVWLTDWLDKQQQSKLANFGDAITLIFGTVLMFFGIENSIVRSLFFLLSTLTLTVVARQRQPTRPPLIYLVHIGVLLTFTSTIHAIFPTLPREVWASILLTIAVGEWIFFASQKEDSIFHPSCFQSAGYLGVVLAGLSYILFYYTFDRFVLVKAVEPWGLLWLVTPVTLTAIARKMPSSSRIESPRKNVILLGILAIVLAQVLTIELPGIRLVSWGIGSILMVVNTQYLYRDSDNFVGPSSLITVGFSVSFFAWLLREGTFGFPQESVTAWLVAGAIALNILWFLRHWFLQQDSQLADPPLPAAMYTKVTDGIAITICSALGVTLALQSLFLYEGDRPASLAIITAILLVLGAIFYRHQLWINSFISTPSWAFYSLAFGIELLIAEILGFVGQSLLNLAIANITLGLIVQLFGDWWQRHRGVEISRDWNLLPLLYALFGAILRLDTFTSATGLMTLAIAFTFIGVGRRQPKFKPLLYFGLLGISLAAYELLLYQLFQLPNPTGNDGDLFVAMAALGTSILYAYQMLGPVLINYLHLSRAEIKNVANFYWVWSSLLVAAAIISIIENSELLAVGTGLFLVRYAIIQGRNNPHRRAAETWVYLGLIEAGLMGYYSLNTSLVKQIVNLLPFSLIPWNATFASIGAYLMYVFPWERWGWPPKPWKNGAISVPLFIVLITLGVVHPISLVITAGFYIWISHCTSNIRFTYLSFLLIDWGILRWSFRLELIDPLWYVTPIALSALYVAQIDPYLLRPERRRNRHFLRLIASGSLCFMVLVTKPWWWSGLISLAAIFAGLALRVRAYLYIGTATFLLNVLHQLVILNSLYAFVKWAIGLVVGITLISIAANFETRRQQLTSAIGHWIVQHQQWE